MPGKASHQCIANDFSLPLALEAAGRRMRVNRLVEPKPNLIPMLYLLGSADMFEVHLEII